MPCVSVVAIGPVAIGRSISCVTIETLEVPGRTILEQQTNVFELLVREPREMIALAI